MHPPPVRRRTLGLGLGMVAAWLLAALALAQSIELVTLKALRRDDAVLLEYDVRVRLPPTVEDALSKGVPVFFAVRADLYRSRWYWRDSRVARATRNWRVAFQPLTATWRVGPVGGLTQNHETLAEALASVARATQWRIADAAQLDADERHYVEFSWRLDAEELPGPMRIGLGGQGDWAFGVERTVELD
ncbi:MAG: DUF4390 domain-containing protein [Rubrivivax sp.]|jgi:hypothetical protein|nr:DUF4390 domain-containing protein [Rubrivivax sp.]